MRGNIMLAQLAVAQAAEVQLLALTTSVSGSSNLVSIMTPTSSYMRTPSTIEAGTASFYRWYGSTVPRGPR